jgi:hypothetical protein
MVFKNLKSSYTYLPGTEPVNFNFKGNIASVPVHQGYDPQVILNNAKTYINLANEQYKAETIREHQRKLAKSREALRKRVKEEEHRREILGRLKI